MLRRRGQSESLFGDSRPPSSFNATPVQTVAYPHTTTYRSLQAVLRVYSPSVKAHGGRGKQQLDPVFADGDYVSGTVTLDRTCSQSGRLTMTVEGAFICHPPGDILKFDSRNHVFYSASRTINVSTHPSSDISSARSAFKGMANTIRRRPSVSSLDTFSPTTSLTVEKERTYPFSFVLPRSLRSGEELPPTFPLPSSQNSGGPTPSTSRAGSFSVEYKVLVSWDPIAAYEYPSFLEAPILYQPDHDFHSLDGVTEKGPGSWLEMPLRTDRPVPFRCAITLPTSVTFSRSSSIPYFVVFTTTPRSPSLIREIASDATISVSLLRQVTLNESADFPPTPPHTPSSSEDDTPRQKIMRLVKSAPSRSSRAIDDSIDVRKKPLPRLPTHTVFSETCTLRTSICIGFPKRPRHQAASNSRHPSLEDHVALPDGLHKAKFLLDKDMLPSIDWSGVSVKYYLDASVLVGQDEVRARVPIRIL
ncbi:hypothetical protein BDZ89DRAFT_987037 [Hymenopellis radicata]|nr:hypothetical protein BDZ89DRAFT_987037 [Hymenopellis radicata]